MLQAEKCFSLKLFAQSKAYLDAADALDYKSFYPKSDDFGTSESCIIRTLIDKTNQRRDISILYSLTFFVFHELSHAKYSIAPKELTKFTGEVVAVSNSAAHQEIIQSYTNGQLLSDIQIQELTCDVYSLYLLFDYVHENLGNYHFENVIDSYFVSVLINNLIDCTETDCELLSNEKYAAAGSRAVFVITTLRYIWIKEARPPNMQNS